jgi:hypothetical protein
MSTIDWLEKEARYWINDPDTPAELLPLLHRAIDTGNQQDFSEFLDRLEEIHPEYFTSEEIDEH